MVFFFIKMHMEININTTNLMRLYYIIYCLIDMKIKSNFTNYMFLLIKTNQIQLVINDVCMYRKQE